MPRFFENKISTTASMLVVSAADLALLLLASWMMALGVGAVLAGILRRRAAGRALVLFGCFSLLYGLRVAISLPDVARLVGISSRVRTEMAFALTYAVLLPLMLLVEQFVGRGWRGTMHATVWLQGVYSVVGITTALLGGVPGAFSVAKPYVVLVVGIAALGNILVADRKSADAPPALAAGFVSFLGTVGVFNFAAIVHRPISARVETAGFVVLVACLAYAVAARSVDTEARLLAIDEEIRSARRIQTSILPQESPMVRGLTVAARYRPMTTMAGDFYDFVNISDSRVGLIVADVLGHGMPAALIASMVKVALNAERTQAADPGTVLTGMNAALVGLLARDRDYVTACYVVIDSAARRIIYGRAGHPHPLLRDPNGSVSAFEEGGTILGQFSNARFASFALPVTPGSRLLLYTDGVTETMNSAGEPFGSERLKALLSSDAAADPDRFADSLLAAILSWRGAAQLEDDITIVVADLQN